MAMMLLGALLGAIAYVQAGSRLSFVAGAVLLGSFMQQSLFFQHDFAHNAIFNRRRLDEWGEWFFGGVCCGCIRMRDEHIEHHAFTNTVIAGVGLSDPQAPWVTDPKQFEFFPQPDLRLNLKIQHVIFLPFFIFVVPIIAKVVIVIENRPSEFAAIGIHWLWVAALVSVFSSWFEAGLFYYVAACYTGVGYYLLAFIPHMAHPYIEKDETKNTGTWMRRQLGANTDIVYPWWMDWSCGGLNLHSVHHLFPRMPTHNYRKAHALITAAAAKHDVKVHVLSWPGIIVRTLRRMRKMQNLFNMDSSREQGSSVT